MMRSSVFGRRSVVRKSVISLAALAALPAVLPGSASAASLTWDNNGNTAPNPQDGAGTWDLTLLNWFDGVNNVGWNNANLDTAVFGAGGAGGQVDLITTVNVGGLQFDVAGYTLAGGGIALTNNTPVIANANATISSPISGAGTLNATIAPGATLTLSGANTFAGGSITGGGTISIAAANNGLGTGSVSLDNVTLAFNDARTIGTHLNILNTVTLFGNGSANGTINNGMEGNGTLIYSQGGVLTPNSGTYTNFTGTLKMTGTGTIRFNSAAAGSPNATYDIGAGAQLRLRNTGNITIQLGAVVGQPGSIMASSLSSSATNVNWEVGGKNIDTTFDGTIQDTNNIRITSITKVGTGRWTLGGTDTYTGTTTINGGTLTLSSTGTLSGTTSVAVNSGAHFDVSAIAGGYTVPAVQTISGDGGTIHGTVNLTAASGIINAGTNASGIGTAGALTFADTLSINGGSIAFSLADTSASGHDKLTVNSLDLAGTSNLVVAPIAPGMGTGVYDLVSYTGLTGSLANLNLVKAARFAGGLDTSTAGLIKLNVTSAGAANLRWNGTGAGSVAWDTANTQSWFNTGTSAADVFYNTDAVAFEDTAGVQGAVNITTLVQPASLTITNGTNVPTYNFGGTGTIGGATSLIKNGSNGTLIISTSNNYTGGTQINGGTLVLANSNAASTGSILLNSSDSALMMSGSGISISNIINIAADNVVLGGNGTLNAAINTFTPNIRISIPTTGSTFSVRDTSVFTNLSAGPLKLTVTDDSIGSLRFVSPNSSFGGIDWDLGNSSVVMFNRDSARTIPLGSLAGGPNTILRGNSNTTQGISTFLIGGGNVGSTLFAGRVTDGTVNSNTGTVAIDKGSGTLVLSGNNTYTGITNVQATGALYVNGSHTGGGAYTVAGVLGGNGLTTSAVSVTGTLSPGASVGVLNVGSLALAAGSHIAAEFGSAGGDGVIVTNTNGASATATVNVELSDAGGAIAGQYPLLDFTGTGPTAAAFTLNGSVGGLGASLVTNAAGSSVDILLSGAGPIHAMWNVNGNGDWSTGSNWTPNAPNGVDYQAYFGSIASSPIAVNVDSAKTVSRMHFNSAVGYTLSGSAITLNSSTGATGINVYAGSHTIASAVVMNQDTTVNVKPSDGGLAISGNLSSASGKGLIKTGLGVLTLSGANTYSGTTTVSAGKLLINGTHTGGGTYSVASGATLGGSGSTASAVVVASGGHVAPGASIGAISVGSLSLSSSIIDTEVGAAGVDRINVTSSGGLSLSGVSSFSLSDLGGLVAGTYTLIDYAGTALADLTNFSLSAATIGGLNVSLVNNTANTSIDLLVVSPIVNATWNVDADGNWSTGSNWTGSAAPNQVDATAGFGTIITSARTVTVDAPQTVGTMNFSSPVSYNVVGANAITMDVSSGSAAVNVTAGSHTVSAPVTLNDNLMVASSAGTGVAFTGNLTATGKTITKAGAGSVQFENVRAAGLVVSEGAARISTKGTPNDASGTSVVQSLLISSGASLDLTNNSMVIDYTGAVGSLVTDVRQHLQSGRLTTSAATPAGTKLGYMDNNDGSPLTSFAGQTVDADSILIKFTYAGDSNLDGQVDITDLAALATAWQTNGVWVNGDFDYSGFIDITDLAALATNWQVGVGAPLAMSFEQALASVGLGGVNVVPEPATIGLLGIGAIGLLARRRRRA